MSEVSDLCDRLWSQIRRLDLHVADLLRPGLARSDVAAATSTLPFRLPESVVDLYCWRDGTARGKFGHKWLFPGYHLMSLEEAIDTYNELSVLDEFPCFHCNGIYWFPVFRSPGTDYFAIRCRDDVTDDAEIYEDDNEGEHRIEDRPPPIAFESLTAMLRSIVESYESDRYYRDENGFVKRR